MDKETLELSRSVETYESCHRAMAIDVSIPPEAES